MTNNIAKLYELAGIKPIKELVPCKNLRKGEKFLGYREAICLPRFTAERQLALIKWLVKIGLLQIGYSSLGNFQFCNFTHSGDYKAELDEALASFIIELWNDLTEQQRNEIKEILK